MDQNYKQCILHRKVGDSVLVDQAWIPSNFAVRGKFLEIKGENGWQVVVVGSTIATSEDVNRNSRDYVHQREASDI